MQFKTSIIFFIVIVQLTVAASAMAAISNPRMINRYRSELPVTIQEYIHVWIQNKPKQAFKDPLEDLLRIHANLMAYGIDIHDDILVAHLYEDNGKSVSLRVFAARLFFHQLEKETGWKPDIASPLHGKKYRIKARNINNPLAEDEFNLVLP